MQSILSTVFWLLVPVAAMLFAFFVIREGTKKDPPAAPDSPQRPSPASVASAPRVDDDGIANPQQRAA